MIYWYATNKCPTCFGSLEIGFNLKTKKIEEIWCANCGKNILEGF